jgi:putative hydrolase of the HAD superfamily
MGLLPVTAWLLVDYGEVISMPLPATTVVELAGLVGQRPDQFHDRYWRFRPPYDLGQSDTDYWSQVMDHDLSAEPRLVGQLVEVDIAGWMTLNPTTLATIMDFSGRTGVRLALLSNAPEPLANAIDSSKWSDSFDRRFYSCRLKVAKPAAAVFHAVLRELAVAPESVLFIDDRAANTQAAERLGFNVARFTSDEDLRAGLGDWWSQESSRSREDAVQLGSGPSNGGLTRPAGPHWRETDSPTSPSRQNTIPSPPARPPLTTNRQPHVAFSPEHDETPARPIERARRHGLKDDGDGDEPSAAGPAASIDQATGKERDQLSQKVEIVRPCGQMDDPPREVRPPAGR